MDRSFIRRSFYVQPPRKGASKSEWLSWKRADDRAAAEAKRRFDRAYKITQSIDTTPESPTTVVDGVHKQVPFIIKVK